MPTKILQITNKPAYPSIDGGCLGMAKMSGFYDSNPDFNIDILTLETFKHPFDKKDFDENLSEEVSIFSVKIDTKPTVSGAVKALAANKSYNLSRFKCSDFEKKLIDILKSNNYEIVQLENIFVAHYIDLIRQHSGAKIILNSANIEYEIWERMSKKSSWVKNRYFRILAKQLKTEEQEIWQKVDGIICATNKDKKQIAKIVSPDKLITIPFYINLSKYQVDSETNTKPSFFHIGAMDWLPNIEGLDWFISSVWNKLNIDAIFNLAGKDMPTKFLEQTNPTVRVSGFVDDAIDYMKQHDVMVVPLLSGSGIRVKIIEAMALGKCVISTSIGAEGIHYENQKNILIADTEKEFSSVIKSLVDGPNKIKSIGSEARKLIENEYDISLMKDKLTSFLNNTIN